jgi:hypothetical protein
MSPPRVIGGTTASRFQLATLPQVRLLPHLFLGPTKAVRCGHDVGREVGEPWRVDSPTALAPDVPHDQAEHGEQDRQPEDEFEHYAVIRRADVLANGLDASLAARRAIVTGS